MNVPNWPPRDWRALFALVFSILGAVVLTLFVWWAYAQLGPDKGWSPISEVNRATTMRWVVWIAISSVGVVLVSLGMAINRRALKGKWGDRELEFTGGDEEREADQ